LAVFNLAPVQLLEVNPFASAYDDGNLLDGKEWHPAFPFCALGDKMLLSPVPSFGASQ